MPIFHLSVKAVSRSTGRSATAAAAYRAGFLIIDARTGEIHDYTRKGGVESADIVLPVGAPQWASDRAKLWNAAEAAEKRKDACVAREYEVALPSELSPAERRRLVLDFAKEMANEEGCAVDVAIHAPRAVSDSDLETDPDQHYEIDPDTGQRHNGNHHAHMLRSTRKLEPEGMGAKLDTEKAGRKRSDDLQAVRARWAEFANARLRQNGIAATVDHRSLEMQGIDREPTIHLGVEAAGYERRTGLHSEKRMQQAQERLTRAKEIGELERQISQCDRLILDLSNDLTAAKAERDRQKPTSIKFGLGSKEPVPVVPVVPVVEATEGLRSRLLARLERPPSDLEAATAPPEATDLRARLRARLERPPSDLEAATAPEPPEGQLSNGKTMSTQAPTADDYELAENIRQRREIDPKSQATPDELRAIDRILVQQARERLRPQNALEAATLRQPEPEPDESHSNRSNSRPGR